MKIFKVILALELVFIASKTISAQQITAEAFADTIHYEQLFDKIVVPAKLGGKDVKFILDTGGKNIIFLDSTTYKDVRIMGSDAISEANSVAVSLSSAYVKKLSFGKYMRFDNIRLMAMPITNYFKKLGVVGLLGSEAFANMALMFKPKEKIVIVYYPFRPSHIKKNQGLEMNMDASYHPIFPLKLGTNTLDVMFDSGMGNLLNLSVDHYNALKDKSIINKTIISKGLYQIGIGGTIDNHQDTIHRLVFDSIKIGNKNFTDVGTVTLNGSFSIVGVDILKYGDLLIDYARSYFYYLPFDQQASNILEASKVWNVHIIPSVEKVFKISGIVGDLDVAIGEQVWEINGTSLEGLKLDDAEIDNILGKIKENTAYIIVGTSKETQRKVMIKKV